MKRILPFLLFFSLTACFAQSGKLDLSFGVNGIVKTNIGSIFKYDNSSSQVLTRADGSIYIILNSPTAVSKRLPDGSIDSSYGIDGYSLSVPLADAYATLQPDGKVLIAGSFESNGAFYIARIAANGTPDSSFGINGMQMTESFGSGSYATSVAVQGDGKIILAGGINVSNGSAFCVVRFSKSGIPDSTFNANSRSIISFEYEESSGGKNATTYSSGTAYAVAIQADGKILVAGAAVEAGLNFAIARLNPSGMLDSTFSVDGKQAIAPDPSGSIGYSLAIQSDGKILLAGQSSSEATAIVRFNSNGSLDNSFNGNGKQTADFYSDAQIRNSLAVQNDGKIVVAGYTLNGDDNNFAVARFNANGTPDNSFNGDGLLTTDINASDDYGGSVAIQANNRILVAGYSYVYSPAGSQGLAVLRYNTDGSLDNSFNSSGKLEGDFKQGSTGFNDIALQPDGKIVAAGRTWNGTDYDFAVVRYNVDGSPDNLFSNAGSQITDFGADDEAVSIAIQSNGKIIAAGNTANFQLALARYNADGSLDPTFSDDGKINTFPALALVCKSLAIQEDGKILIAGYASQDIFFDSVSFITLRLNTDGTPDNTFSQGGIQLTSFYESSSFASALAIQTDGKIVVGGRCYVNDQNNFALLRYNIDGSADSSFSQDGKQNNIFGNDNYFAESLAIQNDGKIIASGFSQNLDGTMSSFALARYKADGTLDSTFDNDGYAETNVGPHLNNGSSLAINQDGRIAVGGSNDDYTTVLYKNNGGVDSAFGKNGILVDKIGIEGSIITSLAFSVNNMYAAGNGKYPGDFGIVARYLVEPEGVPAAATFITAATGNWNQPATWIGGVVPYLGSKVIIRHNVTVTASVSCYSLKVEAPAGNLTIRTGVNLTVSH